MPYILNDSGLQLPSNTISDIYDVVAAEHSFRRNISIVKGVIPIDKDSTDYIKSSLTLIGSSQPTSNSYILNLGWSTNIPSVNQIFSVHYFTTSLNWNSDITYNLTLPEGKYIFDDVTQLIEGPTPSDRSYIGIEGNNNTLQALFFYKEGEVFTTYIRYPDVSVRPCFNIVGKRID